MTESQAGFSEAMAAWSADLLDAERGEADTEADSEPTRYEVSREAALAYLDAASHRLAATEARAAALAADDPFYAPWPLRLAEARRRLERVRRQVAGNRLCWKLA